ncbi:coat protein (CP) [Loquat virus A]|uniref:Coat protein (CP) n=1 Tax=Loquat virus A TaxID=2683823 RepID=A0A6B9CFM5_9VIRU|nr:coat protein (CP) [Loquat virus A]QGW49050.1 coat protein (CP) [Loquat virus A]
MSIVEQIRNRIKRELGGYIWEHLLDPGNTLNLTDQPAREAQNGIPARPAIQTTEAQRMTRSVLLRHYLKFLFGNIAVLGASSQTDYPSMPLEIGLPRIEGLQLDLEVALPVTISLQTFVQLVKAWAAIHAEGTFRDLTFRQICEPFASMVFDFFRENRSIVSNMYAKSPGAFFGVPEVVFDFNKGLPISIIHQNPKYGNAISASNKFLFNRESKKAVFEAQGTVNLNFDA